MKRSIVFLYTELADYIKICLDRLADEDIEVHVFHYPVNPEAPFEFDFEKAVCHYYLRTGFNRQSLKAKIESIAPAAIVCSGWIDKDYVAICRSLHKEIKTILALDNQLQSGLKARLALLRAKILYKSAFHFAWVPGNPQSAYAQKLGFEKSEIKIGFYTVDVKKWSHLKWESSESEFPHRFVFVGRYVDFKGIIELWNAFMQINAGDWQLYCAGHGALYESRVQHEGIHHLGFVQPADLYKFVANGGVFVLPSHNEPWGVVVHEFAAAGYPLICTETVGAATAFLNPELNGVLIKPKSEKQLAEAMQSIVNTPDSHLYEMGRQSKQLADKINVELWINSALNYLSTKNE